MTLQYLEINLAVWRGVVVRLSLKNLWRSWRCVAAGALGGVVLVLSGPVGCRVVPERCVDPKIRKTETDYTTDTSKAVSLLGE
jgi:hypothetical protein